LADGGVLRYEGGVWTLPGRLDARDLPSSAAEALRARVSALSTLARCLAEAQALAAHEAFTRDDYVLLAEGDANGVDPAISELVAEQVLASDGRIYTLAHRGWVSALAAGMDETQARDRHRVLAGLYANRPGISAIRHLLAAGLDDLGLDELRKKTMTMSPEQAFADAYLSSKQVASTVELALDRALALGRGAREVNELRRWLSALGTASDNEFYWRSGPVWLEQLKRDSGLDIWQAHADLDPDTRFLRTLQGAAERHAATPESERVYAPDEAVRHLARHVGVSIAVGGRTMDVKLLQSLPGLLEPFAQLSPVLDAMRLNAISTCEVTCFGRLLRARSGWIEVYQRLSTPECREVDFADVVRNALAYAIGMLEVRIGMASALGWAELLGNDPVHRVSAVYLRRCVRLQQGDWEEAERLRRQAEVLALQSRSRQMFNALWLELAVYATAGDLTGLKQVLDRIEPLAARYQSWAAYRHVGEGYFQKLRGDFDAARDAFERGMALSEPDAGEPLRSRLAWPAGTGGLIGTLVELGRHDDAVALGNRALDLCREFEIDVLSHEISRALAVAEAKCGDYAGAARRLDALIDEQRGLGVAGLYLGTSYEARAQVAIWARDLEALDRYASLTAAEYRHARGSPLGARYERLMEEARRVEARKLPRLSQFAVTQTVITGISVDTSPATVVTEAMRGAEAGPERAARALALICNRHRASDGQLYLFGPSGLVLAAAYLPKPEPDGLPEFVNAYAQRELGVSGGLGAVTPFGDPGAHSWTDSQGVVHWPLLLTAPVQGVALCAGVVVLTGGDPAELAGGVSPLAQALGAHLIEMGEARGVVSHFDDGGNTVIASS
jgi:tetratricopeptide (TPR) repeat protein